jgi:hypothetical protein
MVVVVVVVVMVAVAAVDTVNRHSMGVTRSHHRVVVTGSRLAEATVAVTAHPRRGSSNSNSNTMHNHRRLRARRHRGSSPMLDSSRRRLRARRLPTIERATL